MEASSPLAALHRPLPTPAWGNRDLFRPRPHSHYSTSSSALASVSLREQIHKNTADYFSIKEVRGSSPAASLAADLSQNFRLDNENRYEQGSTWGEEEEVEGKKRKKKNKKNFTWVY